MISINDQDYHDYEVYYLMNFILMMPAEQQKFFYIRNIVPVDYAMHHKYVGLDDDFNPNITNPIYQLFVSGLCMKLMIYIMI